MAANEGEQTFTVYATRCADGAVERHPLNRRTVWTACLADLEKADHKPCGPHTLLSAELIRTRWTVAVEPAQSASASDVVKAGALKFRCPSCGVAPGASCENLTERKRGNVTPTSWPHPARIALWGRL
jgi:predicted RNA-binding Zn-ribbon protein involved in translation (DUF1610 family)